MNNNKLGDNFEQDLCQYMFDNGWWARTMPRSRDGSQPYDAEAKLGKVSLIFECKTLADKNDNFPLSRVRPNQITSYEFMTELKIPNLYFAFQRRDGSFWATPSSKVIESVKKGCTTIKAGEITIKELLNANTLQ